MDKSASAPIRRSLAFNIVLFIIFVAITTTGIFFMRSMLLKQANDSYTLLVENYADQEEGRLGLYYSLLQLSADYISSMKADGATPEEIQKSLYMFLDGYDEIYDTATSQSFGVIDGVTISNSPGFVSANHQYDYRESDLYKLASEHDGTIVATDLYIDYLSGEPCISLVKKIPGSDDMIAFDIFFSRRAAGDESLSGLPEKSSFYLLDSDGNIVVMETPVEVPFYEAQDIMRDIVESAPDEQSFYIEGITTAVSADRNAYVERLSSGGYVVLTVPAAEVTNQLMPFYVMISLVSVFWIALLVIYALRDYRSAKKSQSLLAERDIVERDRDIIEKTTESTLTTYRELMYVDLENDHMQVVYSQGAAGRRSAVYSAALDSYTTYETVVDTDVEDFMDALSIDNLRKVLADNDMMEVRFRVKRPHGANETYLITVTVIERKDGVPTSAAMAIRSMESVLEKERNRRVALMSAAEQAESASRAKSDFLSRMSHDMRTPLNAIKGMTTLALMDLDDKGKVQDSLEKIDTSSQHLLELINSVLDISKIESGSMVLVEEPFKLSELMAQLHDIFDTPATQKGLRFSVGLEPGRVEDEDLIGDKSRLREMLVNVIGNAIKFTPSGGEVHVSVIEREELVNGKRRFVFKVNDTGIGMSDDFLERLFEPYAREESEGAESVEGTGLGMPIALNIARLMGGDIEVSSKLGKGSKFRIAVYLGVNAKSETEDGAEDVKSSIDSFRECDFTGKRALLVDDVEINNDIAEALLGSVGLECEKRLNGKEALDALLEAEPGCYDIVFMDVQMPVMDGHAAATAIRDAASELGRDDLSQLPIIAMTANAFAEDVRRAKAAGMNSHISKPLDLNELKATLQKWL